MNIGFTTPGHERIGGGPVAGILLDDVCRDFGEKQAVSHVTLEINKGEFFLFAGTVRLRKNNNVAHAFRS